MKNDIVSIYLILTCAQRKVFEPVTNLFTNVIRMLNWEVTWEKC